MELTELVKAGILALIKYTVVPAAIWLTIFYLATKYLDPLGAIIVIMLYGSLAIALYSMLITD